VVDQLPVAVEHHWLEPERYPIVTHGLPDNGPPGFTAMVAFTFRIGGATSGLSRGLGAPQRLVRSRRPRKRNQAGRG